PQMPTFGASPTDLGNWQKITSITGLYLGGDTNGSADLSLSPGTGPEEFSVSSLTDPLRSDTNLDMNTAAVRALLVDADGDGIGDSRWEWAPLRQIGATQYVMAVRIIDLSARMDMNVATGRFNATDASVSRGDSPVEMNGQVFVGDSAVAAGTTAPIATDEWRDVLNFRLTSNANPASTTPIGPAAETRYDNNNPNPAAGTRRHLWTDGVSRLSNTFNHNGLDQAGIFDYEANTFGLVDAFELLQGNGVNSANTTTAENLMPNFLRRGAQEDNYAIGNVNGWSRQQFWVFDPRKNVSMFTGGSIAAKPANVNQARELKIDVNEAVQTAAGRNALRNRIRDFINLNPAPMLALYPQFTSAEQLANQLTANIADYIDDDNQLTVVGGATGFEALPYIAEIYTQRHYESATQTSPPDVIWNADGAQGYVIEIGNPFAPDTSGAGRPVSLDNIWIDMNGTTTPLRGGAIAGVPAELAPGEVLLLYRDSGGPAALSALQNYDNATGANNVNTDGSFTTVHRAEGPIMAGTPNQTIGLRAALQPTPNTAAGWNYSACEIELGGPTVTEPSGAGITGGPGVFAYIQTTYTGHGTGLRMMTVTKGGGSNDYTANTNSLQDPSINCDIAGSTNVATRTIPSTLANEIKTSPPAGFANLGNQQIIWPDSERQRMHWIGDILQIPLIGPQAPNAAGDEMAEAFADATPANINALYLPYQAGSPVINATAGSGAFNYPQALMLLEQLTTFNPATDGEDGDGQADSATESIANPDLDEVLVPGKLNLNTAPRNTLIRLLPFPDLATRQNVADAIIARRESTQQLAVAGMGANGIPGIAYTTALYEQVENLAVVNPAGDTTTLGGARIDFNDHETTLGTYGLADGVADDREEELMLAKWLTEVAETRSDVFAAYIVVQGYPADNFADGAAESAKLIIIFSRANVEGAGDRAVEIGRFRIN
ncbi:MAG: hypothetical protein AB8C95_04220, partial [Phycisphaeraceae bacterium]